jgi:hypothetical protein
MGDSVATGREINVSSLLILVRASLVALARRLVVIRPCLILITRRLVLIRRCLILIARSRKKVGATGRTAWNLGRLATGWTPDLRHSFSLSPERALVAANRIRHFGGWPREPASPRELRPCKRSAK